MRPYGNANNYEKQLAKDPYTEKIVDLEEDYGYVPLRLRLTLNGLND